MAENSQWSRVVVVVGVVLVVGRLGCGGGEGGVGVESQRKGGRKGEERGRRTSKEANFNVFNR